MRQVFRFGTTYDRAEWRKDVGKKGVLSDWAGRGTRAAAAGAAVEGVRISLRAARCRP